MQAAGVVVREALAAVRSAVAPQTTTADLEEIAQDTIRRHGARPSFAEVPGYHHALCTSVNEQIVHGIPGERVLRSGDLVSIDCGAIVDGWHADAAISVEVGAVAEPVARLSEVTRQALWAGIIACQPGVRLGDIGHAIESVVRQAASTDQANYGIVRDYVGHGIGSAMHMDPDVPNVGRPGKGARLDAGMAIAIEPMITLGTHETDVLNDGWTVVSRDGSWAAHWEHTVVITADGPIVTTFGDGDERYRV